MILKKYGNSPYYISLNYTFLGSWKHLELLTEDKFSERRVQYWPQMVKIVHCRLEFDKLNPVSAQQVFTYDTASSKPTEFHELKYFNKDNVFTEFLCRLM